MVDLWISHYLREMDTAHALIGAAALAVHGAPRYSADLDLMTPTTDVLSPEFWKGAKVQPSEFRRGDWDDPIAGLVVFPTTEGEIPVDLIVGKGYAAKFAIQTSVLNPLLGCPVVTPLGLALLKLEAGGHRDLNDILALQEAQKVLTGWDLIAAAIPHIPKLSREAKASWSQVQRMLTLSVLPLDSTPDAGNHM